ncbi:MAG: phosphatidylinositol-specific phospholipase C1-like protein [Acidimicrobiales bacterium]
MRARRRAAATGVALLGALAALAACGGSGSDDAAPSTTAAPATTTTLAPDDDLRLNQIQVIGTHNSFHVAAPDAEHELLAALDEQQAAQRRYTHRPLAEQLGEERIRQIELDVFADSKGGLYADPALRRQAGLGPYLDDVPEMAEPGTKVLHEQDVDYHSVCPTLVACLTEVRDWSDANPGHVPIAINIQFKDGPLIFPVPDQAVPEKWTTEAMDGLDAEIASVFPADRTITPDDVRGDHATLEEAVLAGEWPTLGESRGKVLFLMINPEPYRSIYLSGHEGLAGRILFTNAEPGQPDASYVGLDDPVADGARIAELVREGYLVRTRADEPEQEGRTGDTTRLEAALASGAHWISTDHPGPDGAREQYGTDYVAELPGFLPARCNPVTAPAACDDAAVEP